MKKSLLTITLLGLTLLGNSVFALNYGGFNASFIPSSIQELTVGSTATLNSTGIGQVDLTIQCNYDNWTCVAYGPGLVNSSQGDHTIALSVKAVDDGASAPTSYDALGATEATATTIKTGDYTSTPIAYDLYIKADPTGISEARAGYYGAYINVKITDSI